MSDDDTVGSLLASIATSLTDALRVFTLADKRQWGPDEEDQLRALEEALDDAKKDFQEMGPLVNGQYYYENDRRRESLDELRVLRIKYEHHASSFKDWVRTGGPISPLWIRETAALRAELHRAQCRAARRIFNTEQESGARCLGAFLVFREQRQREREPDVLPRWRQQQQPPEQQQNQQQARQPDRPSLQQSHGLAGSGKRASLESLVPTCNAVGKFQRFGERDIAFACDYCDGFIVWEDLRTMPATQTPAPTTTTTAGEAQPDHWQAQAPSISSGEAKTVVFAPLAIANHLPPARGDWLARLTCPFCDQYTYLDQGDDGEDELRYVQDEAGFPDLQTFQEHLEWYHTALSVPALPATTTKCMVM